METLLYLTFGLIFTFVLIDLIASKGNRAIKEGFRVGKYLTIFGLFTVSAFAYFTSLITLADPSLPQVVDLSGFIARREAFYLFGLSVLFFFKFRIQIFVLLVSYLIFSGLFSVTGQDPLGLTVFIGLLSTMFVSHGLLFRTPSSTRILHRDLKVVLSLWSIGILVLSMSSLNKLAVGLEQAFDIYLPNPYLLILFLALSFLGWVSLLLNTSRTVSVVALIIPVSILSMGLGLPSFIYVVPAVFSAVLGLFSSSIMSQKKKPRPRVRRGHSYV